MRRNEHGRDLMQSSFDLFTTRTAETTNMLLRRLTFLSLLLVGLGALVSVFGMDYQPPYAKSAVAFWVVAGFLGQ